MTTMHCRLSSAWDLIARIRGDEWKLAGKAIERLRQKKYPGLLRER
jgi:hypothetical protein